MEAGWGEDKLVATEQRVGGRRGSLRERVANKGGVEGIGEVWVLRSGAGVVGTVVEQGGMQGDESWRQRHGRSAWGGVG